MRRRSRNMGVDLPLVLYALLLSAFGVLMVYSAGQFTTASGDAPGRVADLWIRQLYWLAFGLTAAFVVSRMSLRVLEHLALPVFALSVLLLLLTVVGFGSGAGTAKGTTSWLTLFGQRVGQPSELAKIATVLLLAKALASRREAPASLFQLWQPAIIIAVPWVLILKQEDLGTAIVFVGVLFGMLFWAGVRWQLLLFLASPVVSLVLAGSTGLWGMWFIVLTILVVVYRPYLMEGAAIMLVNVGAGVAAPLLWNTLSDYRKDRLLQFLDPSSDLLGHGWNVSQSMTAIGSGGWFGQGFNEGTQKALAFIPEQQTDFIFAVLGEELGFAGVCLALSLFLALLLRTIRIASRSHDAFSGMVAFGLTSIWVVHLTINVGMTLNLAPVTGIPLPFFSYGGSFLLACWLCVGMLHRISADGRGQPDATAI